MNTHSLTYISRDGFWKCVGKLPNAHEQPIYSVHCAPSIAGHGRIVSCGGDDRINVYREVTGGSTTKDASMTDDDDDGGAGGFGRTDAPQFALDASVGNAHDGDVNCVRWHPTDGKKLVSVGDDGLIKIWRYTMT